MHNPLCQDNYQIIIGVKLPTRPDSIPAHINNFNIYNKKAETSL